MSGRAESSRRAALKRLLWLAPLALVALVLAAPATSAALAEPIEGTWGAATITATGPGTFTATIPTWHDPCGATVTAVWNIKGSGLSYSGDIPIYSTTAPCPELERAPATFTVSPDLSSLTVCYGQSPHGPAPGCLAPFLKASASDSTAPVVRALASGGKARTRIHLRYSVSDDSGQSQELATVYRKGKVVARVQSRLGPSAAGHVYYVSWLAPRKYGGKLRFCVVSKDAAGNASQQSCAALQVRK